MKKSLFILSLLFIIASCKVPNYAIGMSENEFTASQKYNLTLVEASRGRAIYKRAVESDGKTVTANMYYYFVDGKLVRMERVENNPDIIIEQRKS